jgi:hypothetical protein
VNERIVCWFSCGAASAVATKLAIIDNAGRLPLVVARCYVEEEHPDNDRFSKECEKWFGVPVLILKNEKYGGSIFEVMRLRKFIAGPKGAPCTLELKKRVREEFQRPNDKHVFGYTVEEQARFDAFIDANADVNVLDVLINRGLSHSDCLAIINRAGIELPVMYKQGYAHNNCVGCVKGWMGYWNKIRVDYPDAFKRMASVERLIGASVCRDENGSVYLDELLPDRGRLSEESSVQCGIFCEMAENDISQTAASE